MKINKCHFIFIFLLLLMSVGQGQQTASKVEPARTADMTFNPEIENLLSLSAKDLFKIKLSFKVN